MAKPATIIVMDGGGWMVMAGVAVAITATPGCGSDGPAAGTEGGDCYGNGTCNDGLVCLSDLCVDLGGLPDAGTPDAASSVPDAPGPDVATRVDADVIVLVDADVVVTPDASPGGPCNPVSQTGCALGFKCAYILDDPGTGARHVGCAPDGTTAIGDACTDAVVAGETDSCAAGGDCYRDTCHEICTTVSDTCTDGTCVTFSDGMGGLAPIEICLADCDPLVQDCPAGEGCYLVTTGAICVGAGTSAPDDPCFTANGCLPGNVCLGSSMGGYFCMPLCGPWMDCLDAMGNPTTCACGDVVACGPDEICFPIGDGTGGVLHDIAGVCVLDSEAGGTCDCSGTPICEPAP